MRYLIAVSGPVGVGKSSFLKEFEERFNARRLSTRALLIQRTVVENERGALQAAGEKLDGETHGAWVADGVMQDLTAKGDAEVLLVDSVRIKEQVDHLRKKFGSAVVHVHLTASDDILSTRYLERPKELKEFESYSDVKKSNTEAAIGSLGEVADVQIDVSRCRPKAVLARAIAGLGLFPNERDRLVDVLVGAQFGSEGKGNICSYLARDYQVLMRVGGPNAGHKVCYPKYAYVQLPSGTQSNPGAKILIGAGATIWIQTILKEINELNLSPDRLSIDPQAMIIEQSDRDYEADTLEVIGSTKMGVGAATARKILGRDSQQHLGAQVRLASTHPELTPFIRDTKIELEKAYALGQRIMLEGTQGTDLSLHHGFYPSVTSRESTASGCLADAGIAPLRVRKVVMVTRTYPIRVGGTSGCLPEGEISWETISQRSRVPLEELHGTEVGTVSSKMRRVGEFDWEQLRRSAVLNGATDVALTFADYLAVENQQARRFEQLTAETHSFIAEVEKVTNAPVSLISTRFHPRAVIDRRAWR